MENLSLERQFFYKERLLNELEQRSWCYIPQFFSFRLIDNLSRVLRQDHVFSQARIGGGLELNLNTQVRDSQISWIEQWEEDCLSSLHQELYYIQDLLKEHFFLALKRFESQFALYPIGGFYKKHLDQIVGKGHRQVTMVTFLNDVKDGGELILYNRYNKMIEDRRIAPNKGGVVFFFSSQVYHEVLPTQEERLSLTTWMRDDEEEPWVPSANF